MLGVVVPVDLQADGVADHPVKIGDASAGGVEKFPPEELPVQGDGGLGVLPLLAKAGSAPLAGLTAVFSSPPPLLQGPSGSASAQHPKNGASPPGRPRPATTRRCGPIGSRI